MTQKFSRLWASCGVDFDLMHPDLPSEWTSTRYHCVQALRLRLPQDISTTDEAMFAFESAMSGVGHGRPPLKAKGPRVSLSTGDRVEIETVRSIKGRVPADEIRQVSLVVRRADGSRVNVPTPAIFWLSSAVASAPEVLPKLNGRSRAHAEAASQQFLLDPTTDALEVVQSAWAWAGYEAARSEYRTALAELARSQTAAAGSAARGKGEEDRAIAAQIIKEAHDAGRLSTLSLNGVAKGVLAKTESAKDVTTVRSNIEELFVKVGGRWKAKKPNA